MSSLITQNQSKTYHQKIAQTALAMPLAKQHRLNVAIKEYENNEKNHRISDQLASTLSDKTLYFQGQPALESTKMGTFSYPTYQKHINGTLMLLNDLKKGQAKKFPHTKQLEDFLLVFR